MEQEENSAYLWILNLNQHNAQQHILNVSSNKETNCISVETSKHFKRVVEPLKSIIKKDGFSTRFWQQLFSIWKKQKRQNLKNSVFNSPLIVNPTFSQTEFIIEKSYYADVMHFQ